MNKFIPVVGYEYKTAEEFRQLCDYAGVRPKCPPEYYAYQIETGRMRPFVWDGPSTPMRGRFLGWITFSPGFAKSIHKHSFRHDVEHYFGDHSGISRENSNLAFYYGMVEDGYPVAAQIAYTAVQLCSGNSWAEYGWGFGFKV